MITIKGIAELKGPANDQTAETDDLGALERRLGVFVWEYGTHSMAGNRREMLHSLDDIDNVTYLIRGRLGQPSCPNNES